MLGNLIFIVVVSVTFFVMLLVLVEMGIHNTKPKPEKFTKAETERYGKLRKGPKF